MSRLSKKNKDILKYICCPKCKLDVEYKNNSYVCPKCNMEYEIREGVPMMLDLHNLPKQLQHQINYFSKEFLSYNQDFSVEPWQQSYLNRFDSIVSDVSGKVVVDCGTGTGYLAIELARRGATVLATDLTLESLVRLQKLASKEKLDNLYLICTDASFLPIKSGICDYYISNAVLEHLEKEEEAIDEINRICKKNSISMITVPILYSLLNPLLFVFNYIHDKRIGHLRRYSERILKEKLPSWRHQATYYTGHTSKVVKSMINMLIPVFDLQKIEEEDALHTSRAYCSSNLICFFKKTK